MNKQERHTLKKVLEKNQHPTAPGSAYDFTPGEGMKQVKVDQLVPGTPNDKLLDNEFYKAGYKQAHKQMKEILDWLFLSGKASPKDLIRYAGKAK